jgi:cytochrome c oxidase subunit 3
MKEVSVEKELKVGKRKAAKPMLWVSMVSMTMMFAGLTSAYVISSSREDWVSFELPKAFEISTLLIVLSSLTFYLAKKFTQYNKRPAATFSLLLTLALGLGFVYEQLQGFEALKAMGLFFTGPESEVSSSMLLVIVFAHALHVLAGIACLLVIVVNHFRFKYDATDLLGLELGAIFWHFLDLLWIGLFCFFYFNT